MEQNYGSNVIDDLSKGVAHPSTHLDRISDLTKSISTLNSQLDPYLKDRQVILKTLAFGNKADMESLIQGAKHSLSSRNITTPSNIPKKLTTPKQSIDQSFGW